MTERTLTFLHALEEEVGVPKGLFTDRFLAAYVREGALDNLNPETKSAVTLIFSKNAHVISPPKVGGDGLVQVPDYGRTGSEFLQLVAQDVRNAPASMISEGDKAALLWLCQFVPCGRRASEVEGETDG